MQGKRAGRSSLSFILTLMNLRMQFEYSDVRVPHARAGCELDCAP